MNYFDCHLTVEETEAQRLINLLKATEQIAEPGFNPGRLNLLRKLLNSVIWHLQNKKLNTQTCHRKAEKISH